MSAPQVDISQITVERAAPYVDISQVIVERVPADEDES
ncbi:hypothetical protein SAMN04515669_3697 [Jiangella sp. DSM 45060]|nr:hypothetical protein SAMN04515669_3697 [Jiangella sp. DSM 45060]